MESLKPALLLLFLAVLGVAAGQSCHYKKTELKILSGTFEGSDEPPLVKIRVEYGSKRLETRAVRGFTPEWDQALQIDVAPRGFMLFAQINGGRPRYVCYVKAKDSPGSCDKKRRNFHYHIKYSHVRDAQ